MAAVRNTVTAPSVLAHEFLLEISSPSLFFFPFSPIDAR
jgi:hypothetical protein